MSTTLLHSLSSYLQSTSFSYCSLYYYIFTRIYRCSSSVWRYFLYINFILFYFILFYVHMLYISVPLLSCNYDLYCTSVFVFLLTYLSVSAVWTRLWWFRWKKDEIAWLRYLTVQLTFPIAFALLINPLSRRPCFMSVCHVRACPLQLSCHVTSD